MASFRLRIKGEFVEPEPEKLLQVRRFCDTLTFRLALPLLDDQLFVSIHCSAFPWRNVGAHEGIVVDVPGDDGRRHP